MEQEGSQWPESDAAVEDLYLDDDTKIKPAAAANVEVGVDKQVDDDEEVEHFAASEIEKHDRKQGEEEEEEEEEAQEPFMGSGETSLIRTEEALFQLDSVFTCNTDLRSVVGRCFVEVIMVCLKFFLLVTFQ
jgi:deoxycytidine triphosphate deaminase